MVYATHIDPTRISRFGLLERLRRHRESRLAADRLRQLDAHLLRDIGIDRAAIARVVRCGRLD